jgi:hypothetical protein
MLGLAARADLADDDTLLDPGRPRDGDTPEVDEGDGKAVGRLKRQRATAARDRAGEAHDPGDGGPHRGTRVGAHVEAAMLPRGIGIVTELEGSKHRAVYGPGPGECGRRAGLERDQDRKQCDHASHCLPPVVSIVNARPP